MNIITKYPRNQLGYNFVAPEYIPEGADEYYLRNTQNPRTSYRQLNGSEMEILIRNGNTSDDWSKILVSKAFDPTLVKNSKFFGLVRIGKLEPYYLEFHNLKMPVGIYNSTIISTDIGNNVCIDNVPYLSHYIVGNEVMLANINELATTDYAKFGNGILKDGESEAVRIWLELRNENAARKIIPFNDMEAGDAMLWSHFPEDRELGRRLVEMTAKAFTSQRGYYGTIGDRCVIKDCDIIKDVKIGSDAYIKGANKLKNLTINSDVKSPSQIGEGCELVNGIIGFGCRVFYGVKAVRFIMAEHSQLKYGARLINSYLGSNSTISCCEVLNSLIYPAHEQHHNNSFLTAAFTLGQSNIPAGATIGSNHNSRAADGEIVVGRGFWPGLSVNMKHNTRLASFCIVVTGDYPYEMNIRLPFTLLSNDPTESKLILHPGYWFRYNMYALARNAYKFRQRDKREHPVQLIEYDFLAPDTVNEMFDAIAILETLTPDANGNAPIEHVENSHRPAEVLKVAESVELYRQLIFYYGICELISYLCEKQPQGLEDVKKNLPAQLSRSEWYNLGGQLIIKTQVDNLKQKIRKGEITSWDKVHDFYRTQGSRYAADRLQHAVTSLLEVEGLTWKQVDKEKLGQWFEQSLVMNKWIVQKIYESREKDYTNPFRKMMFDSKEQMDAVMGKLEENEFILSEMKKSDEFRATIDALMLQYCDRQISAAI